MGITANIARLSFPVSGAFIQLFDDVGNVYQYEEDVQKEGNYHLKNTAGVEGRTYYIQINLVDGSSYRPVNQNLNRFFIFSTDLLLPLTFETCTFDAALIR